MPSFGLNDSLRALNPIAWLIDEVRRWGLEKLFNRFYGIYGATVFDNADPLGLGRVRVKCPALGHTTDDDVPDAYWAWPCLPGVGVDPDGGQMAGLWFVPDVGANVWVQFEHGDPAHPVWVGGWVTEAKQMPEFDQADALRKGIRTRAGHYLRLSDEDGDLSIVLAKGDGAGAAAGSYLAMDKDGNVTVANDKGSTLYMNAADDEVTILAANADNETEAMVTLGADRALMATKSSGSVEIKGKDITLNGGTLTMNCEMFSVNSQAIYLGKGAAEPAMLGNKVMMHQMLHMHPTSAPGAPTGPPVPPPLILGQQLSMTVFIK